MTSTVKIFNGEILINEMHPKSVMPDIIIRLQFVSTPVFRKQTPMPNAGMRAFVKHFQFLCFISLVRTNTHAPQDHVECPRRRIELDRRRRN